MTNLATLYFDYQAEELLEVTDADVAVTESNPAINATSSTTAATTTTSAAATTTEITTEITTTISTTTTPSNETDFETLFKQIYCNVFNNLDRVCKEYSILELWSFNDTVIRNLTDEEIVAAVNGIKISPVTGKGC